MDQKISQLNSLTKATVATVDVLAIVDLSANETKKITYQELMQPQDSVFRIAGSADNTKLLAFEIDGFTTATTRTITVPDANTTLVGTDIVQTLSGKTLTMPVINLGSDVQGDMYQRALDGTLTVLRATTDGQIPSWNAALSAWEAIANPAASSASTTVKGVVEIATTAEITAGTGTGATGAILVVPASAVGAPGASKIVQYDAAGKLPAVDGSQLTNLPASSKIAASVGDVTIGAVTTETALMTVAIPGGTLGTGNVVRARIFLSAFAGGANSGQQFTINLKYGATTVATYTSTAIANQVGSGYIDCLLFASGATGTQEGSFALGYVEGANGFKTASGVGTSAEDSTGTLNLVVTWKWQTATGLAATSLTSSNYLAEKIS